MPSWECGGWGGEELCLSLSPSRWSWFFPLESVNKEIPFWIKQWNQRDLHPICLRFTGDFYKFQILRLVEFYNFISADEVCLLLYAGLLLKEETGVVFFVLIGKAVRLIQSINCITVYRNGFFSAFGAGYGVSQPRITVYLSIIKKDKKISCLCSSPNTLFILLQKLF